MPETATCLNCGNSVTNKYCANCGQKSSVHRLSFKHFFAHEFLHGLFHIDKGIFFTVKELFTRPGFAALDYLEGKRTKYFNFFTLLLLTIGLILFTSHYVDQDKEFIVITESGERLDDAIVHNLKFLLLSFIPLLAVSSSLFFRRMKLWFSEHLVTNTFFSIGILLIYFIVLLLRVSFGESYLFDTLKLLLPALYLCVCFYQFSNKTYSFLGYTWRMLGVLILFFLMVFIIFISFYQAFNMSEFMFQTKLAY